MGCFDQLALLTPLHRIHLSHLSGGRASRRKAPQAWLAGVRVIGAGEAQHKEGKKKKGGGGGGVGWREEGDKVLFKKSVPTQTNESLATRAFVIIPPPGSEVPTSRALHNQLWVSIVFGSACRTMSCEAAPTPSPSPRNMSLEETSIHQQPTP